MSRPLMASMADQIARDYGVTVGALRGRGRTKDICGPRHAFMAMAHASGRSLHEIGRYLDGRDHTTVLHGVQRHLRLAAQQQVAA